jgi:hypothetical protein
MVDMQIELVTQEDDNFKIIGIKSDKTLVEETELPVVEVPVEVVNYPQPKPATIENQRGLDWFNGTSWGNS